VKFDSDKDYVSGILLRLRRSANTQEKCPNTQYKSNAFMATPMRSSKVS
jgi:hypothetical protein